MLEASFGVKERRACRVVVQPRSTQRLAVALPSDDEQELRRWLVAFAKEHPRWGWKRAYQHRRLEGHRVNKKRIQRLWRVENLKVPYRKRKKPLRGVGAHVGAMSPIRPNAIWAMDFQFDETRDGKQLKLLNITDIFTRECLAIHTQRSITADDLANVLDQLVSRHGVPAYLRCDNGPEFAALAIRDWCRFNNSATTFIDPGSPWQNGHVESFNSRLRDEFLNGQLFESLLEAQVLLEDWRHEYNHERLHSSLCYLTPVEFKELWTQQHQERLSMALDLLPV
jgi:putative transposase